MISEAEVMSKPPSRGTPSMRPPRPTTMLRNARSLTSRHPPPQHLADIHAQGIAVVEMIVEGRGEEIVSRGDGVEVAGEMKVDVLHGTTCERPPPVPPPFMPRVGPIDGSRSAMTDGRRYARAPVPSPMVMVVLPSPAGVG
jgi:hypothetical protein